MTASSDGTARCYDPASGQIMATYANHSDLVTCVGVVGQPTHDSDAKFLVVTGSADKSVCVFNGKVRNLMRHLLTIIIEKEREIDQIWSILTLFLWSSDW